MTNPLSTRVEKALAETLPDAVIAEAVMAYIQAGRNKRMEIQGAMGEAIAAARHEDRTLIRDLWDEVKRLEGKAASESEYAIARVSMADAIRVMNDLMLMVEGPGCVDWRNAAGLRIKDTTKWAAFYCKTKLMMRALDEVEGKEAVQELFAKLENSP